MVGAASQSQSHPPAAPSVAIAAEEEALKRNTDCVYFLASPLTCKKGSECEYRHSDVARLNPRDCWFWLNGNCLNPKCGFRHPPLDGLLGPQTPGASMPQVQTVEAPAAQFPAASSKQGIPCVFFQNGQCLKGDWCPFSHGSSLNGIKSTFMTATASAAAPATHKKAGLEKSAPEKALPTDAAKSTKVPQQAKPAVEVVPVLPRNEFSRRMPQPLGSIELHRYANAALVTNGNPVSSFSVQQPHLLDDSGSMRNKDAEEVSREPSPGFDVLVDDERRDSDYYPSEDQYEIAREHKGRNEYDIIHSTDYNTEVGDERFQDSLGYDSRDYFKGQFSEQRTSERDRAGLSYHERRPYSWSDSVDQVDESDLRHRLAKHKKANGLRSVISNEFAHEGRAEDRTFQVSRRDERNSVPENSLSSRLRGRIRLPGRSSSPTDTEVFKGGDHGRSSPHRPIVTSQPGRIRDRIKGRVEETFNNSGRNQRGVPLRRDVICDNSTNFAGPKSLAELKTRKSAEPSGKHATDQFALGKRKYWMPDSQHPSGSDLSFEGPKPLHEILKRKRGQAMHIGELPDNEDISKSNNQKESAETSKKTVASIANNSELYQPAETEESSPTLVNSGLQSAVEAEDGLILEDRVEHESEAFEQRDREYDYEQEGGEDFELYDENGDGEGEYADEDDDDDDFAKKMGVVYS